VARDMTFQRMLHGPERAAGILRERAGHAFDPDIASVCMSTPDLFDVDPQTAWDETLASEPRPRLALQGDDIDRSLAAIGDFSDLISPYLAGHSSGVAALAARAARVCGWDEPAVTSLRRAAHVHDLGRVAISAQIWQKTTPLTTDDRERIRLHPYYTERVLNRSPFLGSLASIATTHHERLDGGGYHRGLDAATLSGPARILAAADVYQAMTSPRPHREALTAPDASRALQDEARAGRLDAEAVGAVLAAAGHERPRLARPAGLTEREVQVIGLLAHGLPTKQIARVLGISAKTADRHVQNSYAKIGVSSRAAAALFAMQHGLTTWGELPMVTSDRRS